MIEMISWSFVRRHNVPNMHFTMILKNHRSLLIKQIKVKKIFPSVAIMYEKMDCVPYQRLIGRGLNTGVYFIKVREIKTLL